MRSAWFKRLGLAGVAGWLAVSGASSGCASQRDPINRVQSNAVRKTDLVGENYRDPSTAPEWYMRNTIIGVQRTNPYFSDGLQDIVRRVRYEIQEDYLIVRDAYEYIAGSDGHGGPTGKTNNGAVVAMYPIQSHFDIRQGYNPATGESTNVTEENATDRRWYERDYMRVDWSRNLVNDPNFFEIWYPKAFGELEVQPVQYFEENPSSATVSNFHELASGYMDVTSRWLLKPASVNYYGYNVPQCLLLNLTFNPGMHGDGSVECNDQEIVIRTSMARVTDTDYEVSEMDSQQFNVVDAFKTDRLSYDRQYGITDNTWHQFLIRYNIWDKSHTATACGKDNKKAEGDAVCAGINANSTCDLNAKKCTIPMTDRKIRPIAFHVDADLPDQLFSATQQAVSDWNSALTVAVAAGREAECRRVEGSPGREACHAKFFVVNNDPANPDKPNAAQGPVAVICHNPVLKADAPECGLRDDQGNPTLDTTTGKPIVIRKGDIRYHMIAWWNNPSWEAPLGVVVLGQDPLSGEHVSSMANIFGDGMESAIAVYRDWIQLANGDVTPSEYADGVPARIYGTSKSAYANDPQRDPALDAMFAQWPRTKAGAGMTKQEMDARVKGIDVTSTVARLGLAKALEGITSVDEKRAAVKAYIAKQGVLGTPGFGGFAEYAKKFSNQAKKLQAGGLESQVVNDQMIANMGIDPSGQKNPGVISAISPLGQLSPMVQAQIDTEWDSHWSKYHACKYPSNVWGLAFGHFDGIAAKYLARYKNGDTASGKFAKMAGVEGQIIDRAVRGKIIFWELFELVYTQVLEHEMGHNFSLDHNFGASWDAVNYAPQYWQLRSHGVSLKDPTNAACPTDKPRKPGDVDNCMGPRWLDPESPAELGTTPGDEHDQISAYSTSSFMDYHEDSRYWPSGLGQYDKMITKFVYGNVVETFDTSAPTAPAAGVAENIKASLESMLGGDWEFYRADKGLGQAFSMPTHYTEIGRQLNLFDPARCRTATPEEKASGVGPDGKVCAPVPRDHVLIRDMVTENIKDGSNDRYIGYWRTKDGYEGCSAKSSAGSVIGAGDCKIRWPYKHGPSSFAHYPHIMYFDQGADFFEVTRDIVDLHNLNNAVGFYRGMRREWAADFIQNHIFRNYYRHIHLLAWDAINSTVRDASFFAGSTIYDNAIAMSDDWGKGPLLSMTMLFDLMQNELLRPQPGGYGAPSKGAGQIHDLYGVPLDAEGKDFQLGVLDASYIDNQYDTNQGYWYQSYIKRVGHFVEKPLAAIGLTDSRPPLSTVARETFLDGRNVMFSFRSAMPQAFDRLLAGAFADDWDTVAPYIVPGEKGEAGMSPMHTLQLWNASATAPIVRPTNAKVIDPMLGYRAKVPAMILTLLFQPIDSNMEMVNRTRIWVEGGPEAVKVADADKLVFFDPKEGIQWGASKFGTESIDGKTVEIGIGARMLQHANELLAVAYNVKVDPATGRVLYAGGRPVIDPASADPTKLTVKDATAAAKLTDFVGFLNITRQALWWLGFGPLGRGEDDF